MKINSSCQLTSGYDINIKDFIEKNIIKKIDERGWYITESKGTFYLYKDGVIRLGADILNFDGSFWHSKKDAEYFFKNWKQSVFYKNQS